MTTKERSELNEDAAILARDVAALELAHEYTSPAMPIIPRLDTKELEATLQRLKEGQ